MRTKTEGSAANAVQRRRNLLPRLALWLGACLSAATALTAVAFAHGPAARLAGSPWLLRGPAVKLVSHPYIGATVLSASMEPTLHCARSLDRSCKSEVADLLLIELTGARSVQRGDLVSFRLPPSASRFCTGGGAVVKRVIALGGDHVAERDGRVFVNGRRLSEPYVPADERGHHSGRWVVPRGSLFVAGDDRRISCDSRYWGPVSRSRVQGRVTEIIRDGSKGSDPVGPPIIHARFGYAAGTVPSGTMEPTIRCSRLVHPKWCSARFADVALIALSGAASLRRGDLAYFRLPPSAARFCGRGLGVERVIGLAGDVVVERRGFFTVDGHPLVEPYVPPAERDRISGAWHMPPHSLFVLADDRNHSCDSRLWGPLNTSLVRGRVVEIIRPKGS